MGPDSPQLLQTAPWDLAPLPTSCKEGWDEAPTGKNQPFQPHHEQQQPEQLSLPVAQRAMKVCACFRIKSNLSLGSGTFLRMCSMKSCGVTAARFHFNFPSTTSSHSYRGGTGRAKKKSHKPVKNLCLFLIITLLLLNVFSSDRFFHTPLPLWSCWLYILFFFEHQKCQALLKIMRPGSSCQGFTFFFFCIQCWMPTQKFSLQLDIAKVTVVLS